MKFAEHVARITDLNNPPNIFFNTRESKRPVSRPRCTVEDHINPLTPELNLSAQSCLRRYFIEDFATWTVHFFNICVKNQQMQQLFIQFINYVWYLLHVSALHCHFQEAFVVPSESYSIEEQSVEYCRWACCVQWSEIDTHHVTKHITPIHNILSTALRLSISPKSLGTLPENGNVMPKHLGDTIHN
jgi:hypothetical protein